MGLKTQLSREIEATEYDDINRQYDEHAKRILATRKILAYILQRVVDELEGMTIDEIVTAIEGDVEISSIPLLPDSIIGQSLEDSVYREGKIFFDLRFTVRKIDDQVKILFDLEAQKRLRSGLSACDAWYCICSTHDLTPDRHRVQDSALRAIEESVLNLGMLRTAKRSWECNFKIYPAERGYP